MIIGCFFIKLNEGFCLLCTHATLHCFKCLWFNLNSNSLSLNLIWICLSEFGKKKNPFLAQDLSPAQLPFSLFSFLFFFLLPRPRKPTPPPISSSRPSPPPRVSLPRPLPCGPRPSDPPLSRARPGLQSLATHRASPRRGPHAKAP